MIKTLMILSTIFGCGANQSTPTEPVVERARSTMDVIAHRGASARAPENTMAAFRRSVEVGADMIELDVQLSRDGRVVVFHDVELDRTTDGEGVLTERDWEELSTLDAGSWMSDEFARERIPLLDDVLTWSVSRIPLNVEIKVEGGGEPALELTRAAVGLVRQHDAVESTLFSSFDPVAVTEAARLCPECRVALLWDGRGAEDPLEIVEQTGAGALNLALRGLTPELAQRAREGNIPLRVYTINTEEELLRVLEIGAAGVFTDLPYDLRSWLPEGRK